MTVRYISILRALTILSLLVTIGVPVVASVLASRAQLVQRIEPHEPGMALLLGEQGIPIGNPEMYFINDPKAFLGGNGPKSVRLVNEKYLRENNIYPWQLKTLEFMRNMIVLGSGLASLVFGLGWWWLVRRNSARIRQQPSA
jgi:hypothetical protein